MIFGREPTLILGVVRAAVVMLCAFGFDLTVEQIAAVYAFTEAALSLVNRQLVTPAPPQP